MVRFVVGAKCLAGVQRSLRGRATSRIASSLVVVVVVVVVVDVVGVDIEI